MDNSHVPALMPAGVWQLLYHTVNLEGSPQLWRGFRATAGRDIVFSATFFYSWATLEQLVQEMRSSRQPV